MDVKKQACAHSSLSLACYFPPFIKAIHHGRLMRKILALTLFLLMSFSAIADESIIIHVKESHYLINDSKTELTFAELETNLKSLTFSVVTVDVDYCAEPETLANTYLALSSAQPKLKDIKLNMSGSHEESMCKSQAQGK